MHPEASLGWRLRALRRQVFTATVCLFAATAHAAELDRAQLQAEGVLIGEIRIYAGDVFDSERPDENRFIYRLANRLHVETREGTVKRLLLFKVGDPFSEQAIAESERLLRQRRAFFDAQIRPVRLKRGKVVIEVRTRDIWSLRPTIEFGRSGGRNRSEFGSRSAWAAVRVYAVTPIVMSMANAAH